MNVGVKAGGVVVILAVRRAVDELMITIVERLNVGVKAGGVVVILAVRRTVDELMMDSFELYIKKSCLGLTKNMTWKVMFRRPN